MIQQSLDNKIGLNTAGYLTGYRGSPLGGLDSGLWKEQQRLQQHNIVFQPGVNEDLALTAVWGTQQLASIEEAKYDGVFSYWYGKGPGVDRSGDPMKHGNYNGTHKNGGVLLLYGDDHPGKSSTIAHQSEPAVSANGVPSLYPANVAEILEFGLLGWAMSRYSGLWVGLKLVNETVEQTSTVNIDIDGYSFVQPEKDDVPKNAVNIEDGEWVYPPINAEINLNRFRYPLLHKFVHANNIDKVVRKSSTGLLGLVAAGKSYMDVEQALRLLGLTEEVTNEIGLSLYKPGLIWPLEPENLKTFAQHHEELLFIEEKRPFMEVQAAHILYNFESRPGITGKRDTAGKQLFPSDTQLTPFQIARAIVQRLRDNGKDLHELQEKLERIENALIEDVSTLPSRAPYFCSGCPHNTSTKVPENSFAMAGIGCHTMAAFYRADTVAPAQMGGEGAQWSGLHHFTSRKHMFQNLGDGTYFHSGLLCIRGSVASGANITYKILCNDAVAMTGGQPLDGPVNVYDIAHQVLAENISRIAVVSDEPEKFDLSLFPPTTRVSHRDELDSIQRALREVKGTTVILYAQTCAAEKRRRRKKNEYPDLPKRYFINEDVCEGCGDCSIQSTCVSILPKQTLKGEKRTVDQNSCNKDYSCNKGFCPSFITVIGGNLKTPKQEVPIQEFVTNLPEPFVMACDSSVGIMVAGIGGTGVITVSAILGMAAHIEGLTCSIFDMTGLAQKNGAVFSHLKIARDQENLGTQRLGAGDADLLLGFDLLATASQEAFLSLRNGTRVIGNKKISKKADFQFGHIPSEELEDILELLNRRVGSENVVLVDATNIASRLLGNSIGANMFVVGFASQLGLLPVNRDSILEAIELNGVSVEFNQQAFELGRICSNDPTVLNPYLPSIAPDNSEINLEELINHSVRWLTEYQNKVYANRFLKLVEKTRRLETGILPSSERLAFAAAKTMVKLMAYKDEYEVARLHTSPEFLSRLQDQFEGDFKFRFNLAPPLISRKDPVTGIPKKREFGSWMGHSFRLLSRLKFLRGTALDPFGYTLERKAERQAIADFENLIDRIGAGLSIENFETAIQLAQLPSNVRGFGHIKEISQEATRLRQEELLAVFGAEHSVVRIVEPA